MATPYWESHIGITLYIVILSERHFAKRPFRLSPDPIALFMNIKWGSIAISPSFSSSLSCRHKLHWKRSSDGDDYASICMRQSSQVSYTIRYHQSSCITSVILYACGWYFCPKHVERMKIKCVEFRKPGLLFRDRLIPNLCQLLFQRCVHLIFRSLFETP